MCHQFCGFLGLSKEIGRTSKRFCPTQTKMLFWTCQAILFALWFTVVAFVWNNKWRGLTDQAAIYRGPIVSTLLDLQQIVIPIVVCVLLFNKYNIWIAIIATIFFWFIATRIMSWRYDIVFRQYRKLHVWDLERRDELRKTSDDEIDSLVHEWLKRNVKKD